MTEFSTQQLLEIIETLPADKEMPSGTQGYSRYLTQKAHWLGWLSKKPGAKYFRQDAPNRGAKFVYNHIMEPKMLLWLISASGVDNKLIANAQKDADKAKTMAGSCAAIRKVVSWEELELIISEK